MIKSTFLFALSVLLLSCFSVPIHLEKNDITNNSYTNKTINFSRVTNDILKKSKINKNWSRFRKSRIVTYINLQGKRGTVLGDYVLDNGNYLIIELDNNKLYKWEKEKWEINKNRLPDFIYMDEDFKKAKNLIGNYIWLNRKIYGSFPFENIYHRKNQYKKVQVVGYEIYGNGNQDIPIWLKINIDNYFSYVRYNNEYKLYGQQNHYFKKKPVNTKWHKHIVDNIYNDIITKGMNKKQVRLAVGNPNSINNTSSKHGVGEQWIYYNQNYFKSLYFEFDKLAFIRN
tara:strand:- start:18 stop:872 length:855 start_codon:yes stop_codon:yes gene_type:complete